MNAFATGGLQPDLTLLLDLDLAAAAARGTEDDRFEHEGAELQRSVPAAYEELAAADPERWRRIDAGRDPDAVHADVLAAVRRALLRRAPRERRRAVSAVHGTEDHPQARMTLSAALAAGPSHAYLFHGPAGVGKRNDGAGVRRRAAGRGRAPIRTTPASGRCTARTPT